MEQTKLKREIGVWGLAFNIMNIIIGAGIFVLPAIIAEGLGPASFTAYLFCGFLVALIMLCFAEVGSTIDASGGVYAYLDRTLGDYFGFKAASLLIIAAIASDAAVANAVTDIAGSLLDTVLPGYFRAIIFLVIFGGLAVINIRGVRQGISLVRFITLAKIIPLVLFLFLSVGHIKMENLALNGMPSLSEIGATSLVLFFAFLGSESGISVSGEVRNPQKTIPKSIFLAISGVLLLYVLIQGAALGVLGPELALQTENPLGKAAALILGPLGFTLMTVGAGVSMFGNLSSEILSMPRVLFGAANDKVFPVKALSAVHPRLATPYVSILVYAGLDFLVATLGGFRQLAILATAAVLLLYFGVAMAVIVMRIRKTPRPEGAFRIPGGVFVPVLAGITIIWFMSNLSKEELISIAVIVAVLSIIYFAFIRRDRKKAD